MAANSILARMAVIIDAQTAEFNKALKDSSSGLSKFTSSVKNVAASVGAAFTVKAVADFAFEVSKLAGEAEGVGAAFKKIPQNVKLLNSLKQATSDTVSELELMKTTVQASNFGIGLQQLPELLKFAAIRAQQTGQSVEYLVQSIITGIGRKSPLILDNLGISAVRLKEKFNGAALEAQSIADVTKAVGAIASEELLKMGDFSDNASSKVQKLSASWENYKVVIGNAANGTGALATALTILTDAIDTLAGKNRLSQASGDLAAFISGESEFGIKKAIDRLRDLRNETGQPLDIDVQKLIDKFDLTDDKAKRLKDTINEINSELTFNETALSQFNQFAKRNGYTDLNKAADDYIASLNKAIIAETNFQQKKKQENIETNLDFGADKISESIKQVETYLKVIKLINSNRIAVVQESQLGIIQQLQKDLDDFKKKKEASFSTKEIDELNVAIENTQKKLSELDLTPLDREFNKLQERLNRKIVIGDGVKTINQESGFNLEKHLGQDPSTFVNFTRTLETLVPKDKILKDLGVVFESTKELGKKLPNLIPAEEVKKKFIDIGSAISSAIGNAVASVAYDLGQAIGGVGNFGDSILKAVIGFAKQLGEILVSTGFALLATREAVKSPQTAIAAGVALLAIAGAASAALNQSQSKFNSGGNGNTVNPVTISQSGTRPLQIELSGNFKYESGSLSLALGNENVRSVRTKPS